MDLRVRHHLNGGVLGVMIASTAWLASCDRARSPATPTATNAMAGSAPSVGIGGPVVPSVVPWHCIIATDSWQGADCQRPSAGHMVRLLAVGAAATVPGSPSNLSGDVSGSRVTLSWLGPSTGDLPASYVIEVGSAAGRADLANFDTGSNAATLVADGVSAGTYFVRVRARNSLGVSGASNEIVVTVAGSGTCTPAAPAGLTTSSTGSSVTLQWTKPAGNCQPTEYVVEAGSAAGLRNLANFSTGSTATSFAAAGVGAGTYYVRVRAANGSNASAPSNESTLVVSGAGGCSSAPAAPAGLTGSVNGTTVTLGWGSVGGASSYVLEAGSAPGLSNLVVSDQGGATSLTATASPGTYYVRVKAKNACGTGAPSNEIVLAVQSATCSYTLSTTSASVSSAGGTTTVTVTASSTCAWTASSNASFISIASGSSGSGNGTVTFSTAPNTGPAARTGTLTIAGQTVTVTQAAAGQCTFALSTNAVNVDAVGGSAPILVAASAPSCAWTAQTSASFASIASGSSGTGNGTATLSIQANGGSARTATATVAGQTVTVHEDAPLPPVGRNVGCPGQSAPLRTPTNIQFINLLSDAITVFRPGANGERVDARNVASRSGYTQSTTAGTVWQVVTATNGCVASFTAASSDGSAVVQ
jgi:all-beta uncharacterized protein